MKTPQRKFVLEFKSSRRRLTSRPNSIWGNTDLKAFVRQAETEAPHLFAPKTGLGALSPNGEVLPDFRSESQIPAFLPEAAEVSQDECTVIGSIAGSEKHYSAKLRPRAVMTRIREKRPQNDVDAVRDKRGRQVAVVDVRAPVDELAVLDAENRYLKILLAKQLQQENLRLRKMLERFS